jgi:glycosyltransferase involved in cell wall biosynthesis
VRPCLLIPIYDQPQRIAAVLEGLAPLGLPLVLVDDGSGEPTRRAAEALAARYPWVELVRRPHNGGRGAALQTGYRAALARGFTHALQLDADGQHDPADAPALWELARRKPQALVLGDPQFDASAPPLRRYGRWLCRAWVWLETGSFAVADPLCGMRCVPLAAVAELLESRALGEGMEFDVELLVRLVWAGVPVQSAPVRVRYFADGVSHYHLLRDNWRLSRTHAQLCCALLARALTPRSWRWLRSA